MARAVSLSFASPPAVAGAYLKILLARKPSYAAAVAPRIEARLNRFVVDRDHLARYRKVCSDRESSDLPITYPHVLATPLHLAMIACDTFPVSLLGVVHTRNRILQRRPLHVDDAGEIASWVEGHRETGRGQEFDLQTEVRIGGESVWAETCTFMARRPARSTSPRARGDTPPVLELPPRTDVTCSTFLVAPGTGRRYARVSGDFNPIHIADIAARMFGFKRAIAHGMWSVARCIAEIGSAGFCRPCTLDVAFKRPILLSKPAVIERWISEGRVGFSMRDADADRDHLMGSVTPAA
jgi:hypothetical protein